MADRDIKKYLEQSEVDLQTNDFAAYLLFRNCLIVELFKI